MSPRPWLLLALILATAAHLASARLSASERCSACDIAVDELELLLHEDSRTQANIDLRGRIDASGRRHGKVIPYRHSEVRLYGLLDRLCARIKERQYAHAVRTATGEALFYEPYHNPTSFVDGLTGSSYDISMQKERELNGYCAELVDDFQDDFFAWFRADRTASEIRELLCHGAGGHCVGQAGAAPLDRTLFAFVRDIDGVFEAIPREDPVKLAPMAPGSEQVIMQGSGDFADGASAVTGEGQTGAEAGGGAADLGSTLSGETGAETGGSEGVPNDGSAAAGEVGPLAAGLDDKTAGEPAAGGVGGGKDEL